MYMAPKLISILYVNISSFAYNATHTAKTNLYIELNRNSTVTIDVGIHVHLHVYIYIYIYVYAECVI